MNVASRTHIGNVRPTNQDSLLIQPGLYGLFGVADGMGGHQGGDVASNMATLMLSRVLDGAKPDEALLRGGIEEVNLLIFQEQLRNPALSGMGTTLTVLWEDADRLLLGHVGDSRAYRLHGGVIQQITQDHSLVGELLRQGAITPEEALHHPYRNVITRALGSAETIEVDVSQVERVRGDRYLICSDGLTAYVGPDEMRAILLRTPLEEAADMLLQLALDGGGRDNISLVLAEVDA